MARMLCRVLNAEGFEVQLFSTAEEFLESDNDYDCLILDMNLPGMSGIELQQQLNDSRAGIPVIFISAQADEATCKRVLKAGAVDFFSKPFSIESLLASIRFATSVTVT